MKKFIQASYRKFQTGFVKKRLLPRFFSKNRQFDFSKLAEGPTSSQRMRVWFHAASVGELESLWTLIELYAKRGDELILSILSESAVGALEKLKQSLSAQNGIIVYHGFSPWEGEWGDALQLLNPSLFVTAKYEAWPDLWMTLKELNIPLAIVGARARKSLKVAKAICQFLVGGPPTLYLFPCLESEAASLKELFPHASVQVVGEPRWDRVVARSKIGNPRARELIQLFQGLKRPWAVNGSAWMEDLKFIQPILKDNSGTLWVVPHKVDLETIREIEAVLSLEGFLVFKSSKSNRNILEDGIDALKRICILVDEMGFLSELYPAADWAYVGGGWGAGVHSTIEPAIHGIPIGVGPRGTEKFSEVTELSQSKQLSILTNPTELREWYNKLNTQSEMKQVWKEDAQRRLGAAQRIFKSDFFLVKYHQ